MNEITRPLKRRTRSAFAHYRRRIVVMLEPGDVLAMRLEGTRTTYAAPIESVFRQLAAWHAARLRREKAEQKKMRRQKKV
jgi:hypothetical protein